MSCLASFVLYLAKSQHCANVLLENKVVVDAACHVTEPHVEDAGAVQLGRQLRADHRVQNLQLLPDTASEIVFIQCIFRLANLSSDNRWSTSLAAPSWHSWQVTARGEVAAVARERAALNTNSSHILTDFSSHYSLSLGRPCYSSSYQVIMHYLCDLVKAT